MASVLDDLRLQVERTVAVESSATALIQGIAQRVQTAVQQATANGATAEQLRPVNDLVGELNTQTQALSDAVSANTDNPNPAPAPAPSPAPPATTGGTDTTGGTGTTGSGPGGIV